jgi:hypothetical protein
VLLNIPDELLNDLGGFYGMPHMEVVEPQVPPEGWTVISQKRLHIVPGGGKHRQTMRDLPDAFFVAFNGPWWERVWPTERVGTCLLYHIPHNFLP